MNIWRVEPNDSLPARNALDALQPDSARKQLDADGLPHFTCVQNSTAGTLLYVAPHGLW